MSPEPEIESGVVPGEYQPPSEEQRLRLRLSVLDAYLLAAERRADVIDAVAEARDPEQALRSVADLLGITEQGAALILIEAPGQGPSPGPVILSGRGARASRRGRDHARSASDSRVPSARTQWQG